MGLGSNKFRRNIEDFVKDLAPAVFLSLYKILRKKNVYFSNHSLSMLVVSWLDK